MEKINVLIIAFSVVTVHAAVIQNKDAIHKRIERSPYDSCDNHGPPFPPGPHGPPFMNPPPLPPPGFFRARQWRHGHHHGVYGGANADIGGGSVGGGPAESFGGGQEQSASFSNSQHQSEAFVDNGQQSRRFEGGQHQSAGFGSAGQQSGNFRNSQQYGGGFQSSGQRDSHFEGGNDYGSSGADKSQDALKGALNLAKQGSDASGQGGCSSCGKSGYSISNAKSNSGDAVAVSVNG